MNNGLVRQLGLKQLATINSKNVDIRQLKSWLEDYKFNESYADDGYVWLTCILALKAANIENFGVGCLLIDNNGNLVAWGHNEVFNPYFRSSHHAEMVVMDNFEENHRDITNMQGYILYTSLEPCPMCMARLITSGVNVILFASPDKDGGMVHKANDLPPAWIELIGNIFFDQAKCSEDLVNVASQIFLYNAVKLNRKLKNRQISR